MLDPHRDWAGNGLTRLRLPSRHPGAMSVMVCHLAALFLGEPDEEGQTAPIRCPPEGWCFFRDDGPGARSAGSVLAPQVLGGSVESCGITSQSGQN